MTRDLELVDPTPALRAEFRAMAAEWRATGEDEFGRSFDDFDAYVAALEAGARGDDLPPHLVSGNTYWLVTAAGRVVGTSRLRHRLVPHLEKEGGHIGYDIRPSERGKGLGTAILRLTLEKARARGLTELLLTCDTDNAASARIIEDCGGRFLDTVVSDRTGKEVSRYRLVLPPGATDAPS